MFGGQAVLLWQHCAVRREGSAVMTVTRCINARHIEVQYCPKLSLPPRGIRGDFFTQVLAADLPTASPMQPQSSCTAVPSHDKGHLPCSNDA